MERRADVKVKRSIYKCPSMRCPWHAHSVLLYHRDPLLLRLYRPLLLWNSLLAAGGAIIERAGGRAGGDAEGYARGHCSQI